MDLNKLKNSILDKLKDEEFLSEKIVTAILVSILTMILTVMGIKRGD